MTNHTTEPVADLSRAPLPTRSTLRMRRNLPFQFTRFLSFNITIIRRDCCTSR